MNNMEVLVLSGGVFAYALFSRRGESGSVTGPMVFTLFGLAISSSGLGLVDLSVDNHFIDWLAKVTLVLALFTDAARIDLRRLNAQHDVPARLLGIGLPLSMVFGALVAWWLFPGMTLWQAAVLAVILAPTDAALGQAVVSNHAIPQRVRQALNVESGLNDGLAFPVLLIALALAVQLQPGHTWDHWMLFLAKQLLLGPAAGVMVAYAGAWALNYASERKLINHIFFQIAVLALALLAFSGAEVIGGNGFIAAFCAGLVIGTRSRLILDALEDFGETEGQLLTLIVFLLFGAVLLPLGLAEMQWRHWAYAILSLSLIRMLAVALSLVGTRLLPMTVGFLGWFGPRGLASILYLLLIMEEGELSAAPDIVTTVLLTVFLSVLLHGASASPAARSYSRRLRRMDTRHTGAERQPVFPFPTRIPHWRSKDPGKAADNRDKAD